GSGPTDHHKTAGAQAAACATTGPRCIRATKASGSRGGSTPAYPSVASASVDATGNATARSVTRHRVPVVASGDGTASTTAPRPGATSTRSASTADVGDWEPVTAAAPTAGGAALTAISGRPDASENT